MHRQQNEVGVGHGKEGLDGKITASLTRSAGYKMMTT
jgi:hypothetical protein